MRIRLLVPAMLTSFALIATGCGTDDPTPDETDTANAAETPADTADDDSDASGDTDDMADDDTDGTDDDEGDEGEQDGAGEPDGDAPEVPEILDFTADTVDGGTFDASELAGRPVAVWFWAPWCPKCQNEARDVKALAESVGDDVGIVGIAGWSDDQSAMTGFIADYDLGEIPHLTADGALLDRFGIAEQSTWVLLDADGEPVHRGSLYEPNLSTEVGALAG